MNNKLKEEMIKKLLLLVLLGSPFLFTGCSDDDDNDPVGEPAFIIQSTVQTPDGTRTVYFNVLSSLTDEVDIADATEFNSNSRMKVYNGKVYVFDSENVEIIRFGIDENNDLIEEDKLSVIGLGASGFGGTNAIVSEQHAIAFVQGIRQFVFWNPSTMEITGTLDYPDIVPDAFRAGFTAPFDNDGRVFYGFSGFDFATFSNKPGARLVIIDPVTQTAETIFDENIAAGTEGAIDGNGDYYFSADAYFGFGRYLVAENRDKIQTIQRVRRGENTFDPSFNLLASELTDDNVPQMSSGGFHIVGDRFFAVLNGGTDEEIAANPQAALFSASLGRNLYVGSTADWKGTKIPFNDDTKAFTIVFPIAGEVYVVASSTDPATAGGTDLVNDLYRVTESNTLERLTSTPGFFENMARIR